MSEDMQVEGWWRIGRWNETPLYGWGTFAEAEEFASRLEAADPEDRCVEVRAVEVDAHLEYGEGFNLGDELWTMRGDDQPCADSIEAEEQD